MSDEFSGPRDRRYQVFISSTFDLEEERKAAVEAVFRRGHIPIALENFSPSDSSDLEVIEKAMKESQVYVLILGHRYGQIVPGTSISYTELEYDLAQRYRLRTITFVLNDSIVDERRQKLSSKVDRDREEIANIQKLMTFQKRVTEHFRRFYSPGPSLKYEVELALQDNLRDFDEPGFLREIHNPFIVDIVNELKGFEKLYGRVSEQREKKEALARYFCQQYVDYIKDHHVSLFFESGSTVAYVAREMSRDLAGTVKIQEDGSANIQISTNNALAYLQLWLNARVPCSQFPWSPPVDPTFGATYGGLEKNLAALDPDYRRPPLDKKAKGEIEKLLGAPFSLPKMKRPVLLLGAASGLQVGSDHKIKFGMKVGERRQRELTLQLQSCYGPHVGSYHNKVFKRFMYATRLPMVLFITGDKIDREIETDHCHFILDSDLPWEMFCREWPVAFCVGCADDEVDVHAQAFESLGFSLRMQNSNTAVTTFIARNKKFIDDFENAIQSRTKREKPSGASPG